MMSRFVLPEDAVLRQYAEKLDDLMTNWENEIVEFKEAKVSKDTDEIGRYFSALSNEANLRQLQCGWLVFGVSETKERHLTGTHFKEGSNTHLEKFKGEIAKNTNGAMTFDEIIELILSSDGKQYRVLMFRVPAAATGIPTEWRGRAYGRAGESLVPLQQDKIDRIREQERYDWSRQVIPDSSIDCLDPEAIKLAREKFKEKMVEGSAKSEVDTFTNEEFLSKLKLMVDGKLTNAALLLLGDPNYEYLFATPPKMMWRLYGTDETVKDYAIFTIPFINVIDRIVAKIRNLTYRYMPNQMTLFPQEIQQYDTWLLRELLHNCIAHSNYRLGGRIYLNELEDKITITNPGQFLPQSVEKVLQPSYNPPFYLNQLLADTMVQFHMIDTAAMGIRRVFRIQRDRYFPLPDYELGIYNQVGVTVYGKILNDTYMHILFERPDLDLQTVFLLDQVQKGKRLQPDAVAFLRKNKLVEGRATSLYLSAAVAKSVDQEAQYIRNRGFNDQHYKDMILEYLKTFKRAKREKIKELLWDKLPDALSDQQKEYKITNLLAALRKTGVIESSHSAQNSEWSLKDASLTSE